MELAVFYLLAFAIIFLYFQNRALKEDNYFLKESNISIRNEFKKALLGKEILQNQSRIGRKDEKRTMEEKRANKTARGIRIFIFADVRSGKEAESIALFRNTLEKNSVNKIIIVSFEDFSLKFYDEDDESDIEEIFALNDNPNNLPIVFFGGDHNDYLDFLYDAGWEDREDMEWIKDARDMNVLKQALKEISRRSNLL